MADVFVSYAQKDRDVALPIIEAMRRANLSVLDDCPADFRAWLQHEIEIEAHAKCMVFVWSNAAAQSEWAQDGIKAAIRFWSSDRLVLARLEDAPLPVGLKDLSPISIRESGTEQLIERVQAIVGTQATVPTPPQAELLGAAPARAMWLWPVLGLIFIGATVFGVAYVWMLVPWDKAPPKVPTPPPLATIDYSSLAVLALLIFILGAAIGAGVFWLRYSRSQPSSNRPPAPTPIIGEPQVFVSYSRKDEQTVDQLVQQIQRLGYAVWIDRQSASTQRYAAPIVRAIRTSRVVALMCSQNAFASDHVTREVYVAGDCKKPFIVFQLDPAEFPDELRYFVSGFQHFPVDNIDWQQLRLLLEKLIAD